MLVRIQKLNCLTPKKNNGRRTAGRQVQLDFTGESQNEKLNGSRQNLVAVDQFSKCPSAKICTNTETKTVIEILKNHPNIYRLPKTTRTDVDPAFSTKKFCSISSTKLLSGLPYRHEATRNVGRSIRTLRAHHRPIWKTDGQNLLRKRKPHILGDET